MAKLSLREIKQSQLDAAPVVDGQLVFCTDTGNLYRDVGSARMRAGSDIKIVSELPLAPIEGKVYCLRGGDMWLYEGGDWLKLNQFPTSLPANGGNAATVNGHTVNSDVPSGAKFTDTNTWRPVQDNLTSTAADQSLSANQGKVLKGLIDGKAASGHTHDDRYYTESEVDTKLSGKANSSHTHTKDQVGLGNVDNTADSAKSVKAATKLQTYKQGSVTETYGDSYPLYAQWSGNNVVLKCDNYTVWTDHSTISDSANAVAWDKVTGKPSTYTPASHTHNYAGSASAGGSATSAAKLDTATAGSATQPVYFSGGKPVATTYTLEKSVPADAKFTDTVYSHPTNSGNKHIPAGGSSGQILRWSADGTAVWGADNNTTYSAFKGATSSAAGGSGLVPAPAAGTQATKYLRADGTWQTPPDTNTTYGAASQSAAGLMSAADKKKLDGIATGANNYTYSLPTASSTTLGGVKTGSNITNSSGTISLTKANVTSALGYTPPTTNTTYNNATQSSAGLMSSTDKKKLDGVDMANACMYDGTSTSISEIQSTCDYIDGGAY